MGVAKWVDWSCWWSFSGNQLENETKTEESKASRWRKIWSWSCHLSTGVQPCPEPLLSLTMRKGLTNSCRDYHSWFPNKHWTQIRCQKLCQELCKYEVPAFKKLIMEESDTYAKWQLLAWRYSQGALGEGSIAAWGGVKSGKDTIRFLNEE